MVAEAGWIAIGVTIPVVVLLGGWYASWVLRTRRRTGSVGIVQRVRLTCPKCHGTFDYDFVPGAALTALRLGSSRYMACPLCRRWSVFGMHPPADDPVAE